MRRSRIERVRSSYAQADSYRARVRGMSTWQLAILLAAGVVAIAAGLRLRRTLPVAAGFAVAAFVAFGHLTGRFGLEQVWFRAPTFYVAALLATCGIAWWLRRPLPTIVRVGPLVGGFALAGAALAYMLLNGRGAPPAMLMPTLDRPAPDIAYVDTTGSARRLSDLKGDVILINFWATWCTPCRREMPLLAKMQREYEPRRFRVLYLSLEEPQVLGDFLAKNHFDGIQGRIAAAPPYYGAGKFYPLSYLVSRDGEVVARWSGRPGEAWLSSTIERHL
jgi:thiol-disulfide isomerase/thioredoxin